MSDPDRLSLSSWGQGDRPKVHAVEDLSSTDAVVTTSWRPDSPETLRSAQGDT